MGVGRAERGKYLLLKDTQFFQALFQALSRFKNADVTGTYDFLYAPYGVLGGQTFPAERGEGRIKLLPDVGLVERSFLESSGVFSGDVARGGHKAHGKATHVHAAVNAAAATGRIKSLHGRGAVLSAHDAAVGRKHLRHPFLRPAEEVYADFEQLGVVQFRPASLGTKSAYAFLRHTAGVEVYGAPAGSHFMRHAPDIVVRIALGSEGGSIAAHEVFAQSVHETRAVGQQIGLAFPGKELRRVPYADEFEVAQRQTCVEGQRNAVACAAAHVVGGLPSAHVGGQHHGAGAAYHGAAAQSMKSGGSHGSAVFHQQVGDVYVAHAANVQSVHFSQKFAAEIGAAGTERH